MANVLTTSAPSGMQTSIVTTNQQVVDVTVLPEAGLGPTGPTGPTGPSGGGAVNQPLSNTFFVDAGATGPSGPGGGSAINPYNSITQALAERGAMSPLVLLLTPNIYNEAPTYTGGGGSGELTIETLGGPFDTSIIVGTLTAAGAVLTLNNVVANDVQGPVGQTCVKDTSIGTCDTGAFIFEGAGAGQCSITGDVTCTAFQIFGAVIQGDITASAAAGLTNTIEQSSFTGGPTVTVPGADRLFIDLVSLRSARSDAATLTAPVLACLDGNAGSAAVEISGGAGDITSYDVAISDCKVGDLIVCTSEDMPDDVALASAKCAVAGTLTFTFAFSSTVGATTVAVNFMVLCLADLFD